MKVTDGAQRELSAAGAEDQLCFILEWDESSALAAAAAGATRRDRLSAMSEAISRVKAPVLAALRRRSSLDVNDIEGSGHVVVAAAAREWRQLLAEPALSDAPLRILPNERFDALDAG